MDLHFDYWLIGFVQYSIVAIIAYQVHDDDGRCRKNANLYFSISFSLFALSYLQAIITNALGVFHKGWDILLVLGFGFLLVGALQLNQKVLTFKPVYILVILWMFVITFFKGNDYLTLVYLAEVIIDLIIVAIFVKRIDGYKKTDIPLILVMIITAGCNLFLSYKAYSHHILTDVNFPNIIISLIMSVLLVAGYAISLIGEFKRRLMYHANFDTLTGLGNRRALMQYLGKRQDEVFWFFLIKVEGLNQVNNYHGQRVGNNLFKNIIDKTVKMVGIENVFRYSEKQLVVLSKKEFSQLDEFLNSSEEELKRDIYMNYHLTVNIGVAHSTITQGLDSLIHAASLALMESKKNGRLFTYASTKMLVDNRDKYKMEQELKLAIDANKIEVYFQPKFCAHTQEIIGAEALARWWNNGRYIPPSEFISVAEDSDLIELLDRQVLIKAWTYATKISKKLEGFKMSVNYSSKNFACSSLDVELKDLIIKNRLNPEVLELELTETVITKKHHIIEQIKPVRELGIHVSLDDFGTGYTNLAKLLELDFDIIKIDKSFIDMLPGNAGVVEMILGYAKTIGVKVVAEGVETQEQLNWLKTKNCDYIQGFLLGKPMPEQKFSDLILIKQQCA